MQKLPHIWNGNCPESLLNGKTVRMRMNSHDFFESEATGLQICCIPGLQAVILKFRGTGQFKTTLSYGDEAANGELLTPQDSDSPPFHNYTGVFQYSAEIEDYIAAIDAN